VVGLFYLLFFLWCLGLLWVLGFVFLFCGIGGFLGFFVVVCCFLGFFGWLEGLETLCVLLLGERVLVWFVFRVRVDGCWS
jgi:hypothetical protein